MSRLRGSTFQNHKGVRQKPTARQLQLKDMYNPCVLKRGARCEQRCTYRWKKPLNQMAGFLVLLSSIRSFPKYRLPRRWSNGTELVRFNSFSFFFFQKFNLVVLQRRLITSEPESWYLGKTFKTMASFLLRLKFWSLQTHVLSQALEKLIHERKSCKNLYPNNLVFLIRKQQDKTWMKKKRKRR